jgi:hypothetical protein
VSFSDTQLPVVDLFVRRFGQLVSTDEIVDAYRTGGGTVSRNGVRGLALRIRKRITDLDLNLYAIRRKGFVLDWHHPEPTRDNP